MPHARDCAYVTTDGPAPCTCVEGALMNMPREELEAQVMRLRNALRPFAEPHAMGDNYVQFAPRLIEAARVALANRT